LYKVLINLNRLPDVICITETRIKGIPTTNVNLNNYNLIYSNSPTNAGGVAMYLLNTINYDLATEYSINIDGCEGLWVNVDTSSNKLLLGVVYKHPKSKATIFLESLDLNLQKLNDKKGIIMGDFNINLLLESTVVEEYKNIIAQNAFLSIVNIPTRVTETSKTLLDHILTNILSADIKPSVLQCNLSDHFPTLMQVSKLNTTQNFKSDVYKRNMKNFNSESFSNSVALR